MATLQNISTTALKNWVGDKVFARARSYIRVVDELCMAADGGLIAWVQGNDLYATKVLMKDGGPESFCTCPYGVGCKHAVATVLRYQQMAQNGETVPAIEEDDERLTNLSRKSKDPDTGPTEGGQEKKIRHFLKGKSKDELCDMLMNNDHEGSLHRDIVRQIDISSDSEEHLVKTAISEIRRLVRYPAWYNAWKHEGHLPDYSGVRQRLEKLLQMGCADSVIKVGDVLFQKGTAHVETSNDEGHTQREVAECLDVVFAALPRCSMAADKKLLWAIDKQLQDGYGLCDGLEKFFSHRFKASDWSQVADSLYARLKGLPAVPVKEEFSFRYNRDRLTNTLIDALDRSGRGPEVIPLCVGEASITDSYERLVKRLCLEKRLKEAKEWVFKGIASSKGERPTPENLRLLLEDIYRKEKNYLAAASVVAESFYEMPSRSGYEQVRLLADKAGVWTQVRPWLLHFLKTGEHPLSSKAGTEGVVNWGHIQAK